MDHIKQGFVDVFGADLFGGLYVRPGGFAIHVVHRAVGDPAHPAPPLDTAGLADGLDRLNVFVQVDVVFDRVGIPGFNDKPQRRNGDGGLGGVGGNDDGPVVGAPRDRGVLFGVRLLATHNVGNVGLFVGPFGDFLVNVCNHVLVLLQHGPPIRKAGHVVGRAFVQYFRQRLQLRRGGGKEQNVTLGGGAADVFGGFDATGFRFFIIFGVGQVDGLDVAQVGVTYGEPGGFAGLANVPPPVHVETVTKGSADVLVKRRRTIIIDGAKVGTIHGLVVVNGGADDEKFNRGVVVQALQHQGNDDVHVGVVLVCLVDRHDVVGVDDPVVLDPVFGRGPAGFLRAGGTLYGGGFNQRDVLEQFVHQDLVRHHANVGKNGWVDMGVLAGLVLEVVVRGFFGLVGLFALDGLAGLTFYGHAHFVRYPLDVVGGGGGPGLRADELAVLFVVHHPGGIQNQFRDLGGFPCTRGPGDENDAVVAIVVEELDLTHPVHRVGVGPVLFDHPVKIIVKVS